MPTTKNPLIIQMLDLSTAHLPEAIGRHDSPDHLNSHAGVVADKCRRGWMLWVPDDPQAHAEAYDEGSIPAEVLAVQIYARALDCDWVKFDADGQHAYDLPSWTW